MQDNFDEIVEQSGVFRDAAKFYAGEQGKALLDICAGRLTDGRPIAVIGMGSSLYASRLLAGALRTNAVSCICMPAEEAMLCTGVLAGFTLVLLSQSGESGEMVELVRMLPRNVEQGVVITNAPTSTLGVACPDATLPMLAGKELFCASRTFTNTLLIAALLGARVGRRTMPSEALQSIAAGMERLIVLAKPSMDAARTGAPIATQDVPEVVRVITSPAPAFFVGCDLPGEVVACQAGLIFKEVARSQTEGHSLGTFRHGPQETLATRPNVAFVAREFDGRVVRYIDGAKVHGAQVTQIDAGMMRRAGIDLVVAAGDLATAVLSAMIIELWAIHTSYRSGYRPGHFLVGGKVTGGIDG